MSDPQTTDYLKKYGQFFVDKWATAPSHASMPEFFEWMKSIFDAGEEFANAKRNIKI